ncbi:MAG: hypothetical protein IJA63_06020 [Akkermansia sp.]|nr:hypothetical protein [Akkermansia sp.]
MDRRKMLMGLLHALRRCHREASVRVYEVLFVLEGGSKTSRALERVLGHAGTRRVLYEAWRDELVQFVGDEWHVTEKGKGVISRLKMSVYGEGEKG